MHPNFQTHTNQLRSEKEQIRASLAREIDLKKRFPGVEVLSTKKAISHVPHRPRMVEVSGLTGHRMENAPESLQEGFTGIGNILNQTPHYESWCVARPGVKRSHKRI